MRAMTQISEKAHDALQRERQKADGFLFYLLLGHVPFAALIFPYGYDTYWVGISGAAVLFVVTILGRLLLRKTVLLRHLYAVTLLSYSILFIQVQMGRIEMHFHIFGALAFLLIYRDWKPVITGAGLAAVHHVVFNLCQQYDIAILGIPVKVFNYGTGWDIVTLHAFFVVFESSILVYYALTFRANFLKNQDQIRRLDAVTEELNRIVQKSWDVSQKLRDDTATLVSSSATLSGIASETAAGVEEINAGLDSIFRASEDISQNTTAQTQHLGEIRSTTDDVQKISDQITVEIQKTGTVMNEAVQGANEGNRSIQSITQTMDAVRESSNEMLDIVDIINEIAEQVSLLSLNASIEAARAGESGRGFAVVAQEISKLAQRTADSTRNINELIGRNASEIETGLKVVTTGSEKIRMMITRIEEANRFIQGINRAMQQFADGYRSIHSGVESAAAVSRRILDATDAEKNAIQEVIGTISHINSSAQGQARESDELRILAEKNRQLLDELQGVLQTLLDSGRSKLQL